MRLLRTKQLSDSAVQYDLEFPSTDQGHEFLDAIKDMFNHPHGYRIQINFRSRPPPTLRIVIFTNSVVLPNGRKPFTEDNLKALMMVFLD